MADDVVEFVVHHVGVEIAALKVGGKDRGYLEGVCHGGCLGAQGGGHHHVHANHGAVFGNIYILWAQQSLHGFPALHGGIHHHAGVGIVGHKLSVEAIHLGVVRTFVVVGCAACAVHVYHQFYGALLLVKELLGKVAEVLYHVHALLVRHIHCDNTLLHMVLVIYGDGGTCVVIAVNGEIFLVEPQFSLGAHQCAVGIGTQCRGGGQCCCSLFARWGGGHSVPCLEGCCGARCGEHCGLLHFAVVYHGQVCGCSVAAALLQALQHIVTGSLCHRSCHHK